MILKAEDFSGSRIAQSIIDPNRRMKQLLDEKFSKGIIDAELYNKALKQLPSSGAIQKGEIMDRLGYGYGGSEALKFTKTGKELKAMLPDIIAKLGEQRSILLGQMAAFKTLAGIEPTDSYGNGIPRYDWSCCEQPYDQITKQYPAPTEQNKACRSFNDCASRIRSIDEDIVACKAIMAGADDKQKYNLSIAQMMALSGGSNSFGKAEESDIKGSE